MDMIRHPAYELGDRPFMVIWETTQACDLACKHCRAEASPKLDPLALTTEQAKELIDQIEKFGKPRPIVIFTGGDPFKRHDLFDLIQYGSHIGLPVCVSPSGTPLLNAENLKRVKYSGAKAISLSIDGSDCDKHDNFRGVVGSFEWTTNGWREARKIGLKVQINTTVTRYNLLDLPEIFRLVSQIGAMTWSLFFLVPTGRGKKEDEISPAEYEAVMNFLYDVSHFISAKPTEGHHYKRVVLQRTILEKKGLCWRQYMPQHPIYHQLSTMLSNVIREEGLTQTTGELHRTPMHINAANGFVFISQRGEVFPSGFLPLSAGNIRDTSLTEIYCNSKLFQDLRNPDQFGGRCGVCEFKTVCGGSRSRAFAMTGDPFAEEAFCNYQPGSFPFQSELQSYI
jgi:AdoMet-dependent heme synthase